MVNACQDGILEGGISDRTTVEDKAEGWIECLAACDSYRH